MKIGTVVVWYNPDDDVYSNIKSYYNQSDRIYVIDNSKENNEELLKDLDVNYVPLYDNTGLAHALNIGMDMAIKDGCDWIMTMDQDSAFENNIVDIYRKYIEENNTDKVAILCPQYHTDRNTLKEQDGYVTKKFVMQSACLLNSDIFIKEGKFLEKLFIECVDLEYCLRVVKDGYKIIECTSAILMHKPAITYEKKILFKTIKYGYASPLRYYYQIRNLKYLVNRYKSMDMFMILLIKVNKIIFLFDNKSEFKKAIKMAKYDYKHNIYGRKDSI